MLNAEQSLALFHERHATLVAEAERDRLARQAVGAPTRRARGWGRFRPGRIFSRAPATP